MGLRQRLRRGFLTIIKYTLNPLTLRFARSGSGPFAIVRHVGRRSGKQYETPIIARPTEDGFIIELTYGYEVDWHKNVLAAGGCTLLWHGREFKLRGIQRLETELGLSAFSPFQRSILHLLNRRHFEKLTFHSNAADPDKVA